MATKKAVVPVEIELEVPDYLENENHIKDSFQDSVDAFLSTVNSRYDVSYVQSIRTVGEDIEMV